MRALQKEVISTVACLLFFGLFFLTSCSEKEKPSIKSPTFFQEMKKISENDKIWLDKFFQDFFLQSPVIYTLFGSKPMSMMTIVSASEQEWIDSSSQCWQNLQEPEKSQKLQEIREYAQRYDLHINWKKWMHWHQGHPQTNFLFLTHHTDSEHLFNVYVINTKEVLRTLEKHYALFARKLNMKFDPLGVILDFENPESEFWLKVFSNPLLEGILFDYGKQNASLFSQEFGNNEQEKKETIFSARSSLDAERLSADSVSDTFGTGDQISIPPFRSYRISDKEDHVVVKYHSERKKILKKLNKKDVLQEVLNRLYKSSEDPIRKVL